MLGSFKINDSQNRYFAPSLFAIFCVDPKVTPWTMTNVYNDTFSKNLDMFYILYLSKFMLILAECVPVTGTSIMYLSSFLKVKIYKTTFEAVSMPTELSDSS